MKSYSLDLRKKIIETYENEPISQRNLAKRFRVATSSVTRFLKQYRQTGQLEPKPRPGRPKTLNSDHVQVVQDLVSAQPDITLAELCDALHEQTKVKVSEPTMCRVLKRLNLTPKKESSSQRQRK
jgi:transposase